MSVLIVIYVQVQIFLGWKWGTAGIRNLAVWDEDGEIACQLQSQVKQTSTLTLFIASCCCCCPCCCMAWQRGHQGADGAGVSASGSCTCICLRIWKPPGTVLGSVSRIIMFIQPPLNYNPPLSESQLCFLAWIEFLYYSLQLSLFTFIYPSMFLLFIGTRLFCNFNPTFFFSPLET